MRKKESRIGNKREKERERSKDRKTEKYVAEERNRERREI